jgi:hypothetical protein
VQLTRPFTNRSGWSPPATPWGRSPALGGVTGRRNVTGLVRRWTGWAATFAPLSIWLFWRGWGLYLVESMASIELGQLLDLSEADSHFNSNHGASCSGWDQDSSSSR